MPGISGMDLVAAVPMIQWKIGCSGYHYPEWKGLFYPERLAKNKWFDFYCQHFNTIELNVTFYRFPKVEWLKNWYNRSPAGFTFTVKAPRVITHFKKFKESQHYLSDFYRAITEGLGEKAAAVLFQFPANFHFDEDRLDRIVRLLNQGFRNVVEFRHASWWQDKVFRSLAEHKITFSGMSHPSLPEKVIQTSNLVYYRFHGVPHLYTSRYELPQLDRIVQEIQTQPGVEEGYLYFNNTAEGSAIENAHQLQEICELVH
jgi:uncharacterized protein YecE (DUF72 family)